MARHYKSITDLIAQGKEIQGADDKFAGEIWRLPEDMRANLDEIIAKFFAAQAKCHNIRTAKAQFVAKSKAAHANIVKTLARLKQFIRAVADKEKAHDMFHEFGILKKYPRRDSALALLLRDSILKNLDDFDGTPQEISAELKAEVRDNANEYISANFAAGIKIAESNDFTQDRNHIADDYTTLALPIRNWLYLKLPPGKHDARLADYGFKVWRKQPANKMHPPRKLAYDDTGEKFSWEKVRIAHRYQIEIAPKPEDEAEPDYAMRYDGEKTRAHLPMTDGEYLARVRSVRSPKSSEGNENGGECRGEVTSPLPEAAHSHKEFSQWSKPLKIIVGAGLVPARK